METDSFFYQLLKQLPETLFALLDQPLTDVAHYRFDALEVKKSYRLDGLFVPTRADLPVYFVEVQFRRARRFYANLFAKVFSYLEANDPEQEWMAVALFPDRAAEPKRRGPYEDLLGSRRVRRIYLEELKVPGGAPPGLSILQLATSAQSETFKLVTGLLKRARKEPDCERADVIVELIEEVLIRRYHELDRVEIRRMFKLHDIRKTRVWQEAHEEGIEQGIEKGRALEQQQLVARLQAHGQKPKEIADLLGISLAEVRRLLGARSTGVQ